MKKAKKKIASQSKSKSSTIQRKIWELCRKIIRIKYPNVCYTCGMQNLEGQNLQTGHMIAKGSLGAYLKYDIRLLRPQCATCNIWRGGMGAMFIENMREVEGDDYVDEILADRNVTVPAYEYYVKLLDYYQRLLPEIEHEPRYDEEVVER